MLPGSVYTEKGDLEILRLELLGVLYALGFADRRLDTRELSRALDGRHGAITAAGAKLQI